jgi:hypothetical protein
MMIEGVAATRRAGISLNPRPVRRPGAQLGVGLLRAPLQDPGLVCNRIQTSPVASLFDHRAGRDHPGSSSLSTDLRVSSKVSVRSM